MDSNDIKLTLIKTLKQYSEYLIDKNRYDEAAEQLIETIDLLKNNTQVESNRYNSDSSSLVEPSWVITKLVEQSGLRSGLRMYLEALHAAGVAKFAHTKVLITCYKHDRLRSTILKNSNNTSGSSANRASLTKSLDNKITDDHVINTFSNINWNEHQVDTAIALCRNSGLYSVAETVARRKKRYVQLSKTLIEDLNQPSKVLELLKSLSVKDVLPVILQCGKKLLGTIPNDFVSYLVDTVCKSSVNDNLNKEQLPKQNSNNSDEVSLTIDTLKNLFVDKPQWRAILLQKILARPGGLSATEAPKAWIFLFESLVCVDLGQRLETTLNNDDLPQGQQVNKKRFDDNEDPKDDHENEKDENEANTDEDIIEQSEENEKRKDSFFLDKKSINLKRNQVVGRKALKILQSRWSVIDLRGALEIAEQYGHGPCLEYLYEHLRMYKELGVCLRLSCNYSGLLRACQRHGEREPYLWLDALRLFAPAVVHEEKMNKMSGNNDENVINEGYVNDNKTLLELGDDEGSEDSYGYEAATLKKLGGEEEQEGKQKQELELLQDVDHKQEINEENEDEFKEGTMQLNLQDALDKTMLALERNGILSPLEIIEAVVESCGEGKWGIVREFFERYCASLRRDAITSEHSSAMLENEGRELKKEAVRLRDETIVIKPGKCAACEDTISLPAIHFFCGCSYCVSCLATASTSSSKSFDDSNSVISASTQALEAKGYSSSADGNDDKFSRGDGSLVEECIKCAPELDAVLSMKKAILERNEKHDEFYATLHSARDGFGAIVEFLERSPFL